MLKTEIIYFSSPRKRYEGKTLRYYLKSGFCGGCICEVANLELPCSSMQISVFHHAGKGDNSTLVLETSSNLDIERITATSSEYGLKNIKESLVGKLEEAKKK